MSRAHVVTLSAVAAAVLGFAHQAAGHCQVPCGIYGDQMRFERMLEDQTTVAKAMAQINELSGKSDALSHNQLARWVVNKEEHATNTQRIIADYFMAQRIKPGADKEAMARYLKQLTAAHKVMQAAMKAKQTVDSADAEALKQAIFDFYEAYEGKEFLEHAHE